MFGKSLFNEQWKFLKKNESNAWQPQYNDEQWSNVNLPHDWMIEGPFQKDRPEYMCMKKNLGESAAYLPGGTTWYRKSWKVPSEYKGNQISILFDGIYMDSDIWLNGQHLGNHPYGYTSFAYDLTPFLKFGEDNILAVRVRNEHMNSRWYSGSGIYRNVWILVQKPLHVALWGTYITTSNITKDSALVRMETTIENSYNDTVQGEIFHQIVDPTGKVIVESKKNIKMSGEHHVMNSSDMKIPNPLLWSCDTPQLYKSQTQIIVNAVVIDECSTSFGIRTARFDPDLGFFLNEKNMKILGVCNHHDLGALGSAFNYRARQRQLELLKAMGCNAIRTSHNPPEPELLDLCDQMGILVMDEAFDEWLFGKRTKGYHRFYLNWWKHDLDSMVRRDRNHPCIIIWSVGNELFEQHSWIGVYLLKKMMKFIRTLDKTRPITHGCNGIIGANRTGFAKNLDIVGYNYFGVFGYKFPCKYDLDHIKYPKRIIIGSETSSAVRTRGVYHFPANQNILTHPDMQCSSYDNSWVSWGDSAQTSWRALRDRPFVAGEFIWTGLDYLGEPTPYPFPAKSSYFGIIDTCGFPKDIYYFYQSQWSQTPVLHILPHWNWEKQVKFETLIPVWVYTNCDEAELFLNGKSMGVREFAKTDDLHLEWSVPYVPGELKAVGKKNGQIILTSIVKTTSSASKIQLIPDRSQIKADGKDLSFITVKIEDSNGNMVPDAQNLIEFSIEGMGTIVGLDNGNPICLESYQGNSRSVFNGLCLVIVRGLNQAGSIFISAKSNGLQSSKLELQSK